MVFAPPSLVTSLDSKRPVVPYPWGVAADDSTHPFSTLALSTGGGNETIPAARWDDVERSIIGLDGETHSTMSLESDDSTGLFVFGGPDRYVLWVQRWDGNDLVIDTAVDPHPPAGSMLVTLDNGQVDEVPLAKTVDLGIALRSSLTFSAVGALDSKTHWAHQGPPSEPNRAMADQVTLPDTE